jgi:hypothetical protein
MATPISSELRPRPQAGNANGVSVDEVLDAYEANGAAAHQKYGRRQLEIAGVVDSVHVDDGDQTVFLVGEKNPYRLVMCRVGAEPSLASLARGQALTVRGYIRSGSGASVTLEDCKLV